MRNNLTVALALLVWVSCGSSRPSSVEGGTGNSGGSLQGTGGLWGGTGGRGSSIDAGGGLEGGTAVGTDGPDVVTGSGGLVAGTGGVGVVTGSGGLVAGTGGVGTGGAARSTDAGGATARPAVAPEVEISGQAVTWNGYSFIVPPTMSHHYDEANGFYVIERSECLILMLPLVPTQADPDAQALTLLRQLYVDPTQWGGLVGSYGLDPLADSYHRRGVAGAGWRYIDLTGNLLNTGGAKSGEVVRILLADLGTGQSAVMLGYQVARAKADCVQEVLNPHEWVLLTYSLSFPAARPSNPHAFRDELVGGWFGASGGEYVSLGWSDIYAANGRYTTGSTVSEYSRISPTDLLETSSSWAGSGAYAMKENLLQRWPDNTATLPSANYVRIVKEYNTSTPQGWRWYIYKLAQCGASVCEGWSSHE